jgi:hypothetical protein
MRKRNTTRIDGDRPAGTFEHLIVLLLSKIGLRPVAIQKHRSWIVRADPNCLVKKFEAFFILPRGTFLFPNLRVLSAIHGGRRRDGVDRKSMVEMKARRLRPPSLKLAKAF